jgi:superfamily II DNA or RNA helicase
LSYRKDHVYALEAILKGIGIRCGSVTGDTSKNERNGLLNAPEEWDAIISTVHLFKEGLDIKALDTVFIALPFKDATGIQQSEGRVERPMEGKKEPLFIFAYDANIPYCELVEAKMRRIVRRKRK